MESDNEMLIDYVVENIEKLTFPINLATTVKKYTLIVLLGMTKTKKRDR